MRQHIIGKCVQATVVTRLAFSGAAESCSSSSTHRINLFGYVLFTLLIGRNFREPLDFNVTSFQAHIHICMQQTPHRMPKGVYENYSPPLTSSS